MASTGTPPPVDPELGPPIAGDASYVGGTYAWTDYAYDDRGSNSNGLAGGDATYPDNPYPGNAADLIQLQIGTTPKGALRIAAVLQTLVEGADALIGVGFDTDRNIATGGASVPGGQWANSEPLGLEGRRLGPVERPIANRMTLSLANLRAGTIDLARAGIRTDQPVTLDVTGDGATRLTLLAPWPGRVTITRDGVPVGEAATADGRLVLNRDLRGTHRYVITRA